MRAVSALLFDLDNTLIFEDQATFAAVRAACEVAASRGSIDVDALGAAVLTVAEQRFRAAPTYPFCDAMGIWWGEALWGEFAGDGADLAAVRAFAPRFRREVWRDALRAVGQEGDLADDLVDAYRSARRSREVVDPAADAVLADLARDHRLAIVTNGAPDVQREKLSRTPLARHFGAIVISVEVGVGKPDPRIFRIALDAIGAERAVMVGDSLPRDVAGARGAGLPAIWIDRGLWPASPEDPVPDARVTALSDLRAALAALAPGGASPRGSS